MDKKKLLKKSRYISVIAGIIGAIASIIALFFGTSNIVDQISHFIAQKAQIEIDSTAIDTTFSYESEESINIRISITDMFYPTGYLGDGEFDTQKYLRIHENWTENPHSQPSCIRIEYRPGQVGWAGLIWQNSPDNWGESVGLDLSNFNFRRITFWAKGNNGGERVEFLAGTINEKSIKYNDSFRLTRSIELTSSWKRYEMNLDKADLSNVISGFGFSVNKYANPKGLIFYLDDIYYE